MKKLAATVALAALVSPLFAQEASIPDVDDDLNIEETQVETAAAKKNYAMWPVFFALGDWPETPDIVGIRLTIPWSTKQENVTGVDIGLWGRARYYEGFMLNIFRNDVKDCGACYQVGLYNSIGQADAVSCQVGLWNEAGLMSGVQAGLVNTVGDGTGVQIGLLNRAEQFYGVQIGLVNVIRDAELQFMPFVNVGF